MGARWLPVGWLGERWSGRVPGWAQMLDRAGVRWRRSGWVPGWVSAGRGGCQVGAVVVDEEVSSNKIGL